MTTAIGQRLGLLAVLAATTLAGCERPPMEAVQRGYRGTGMEQVVNPRTAAEQVAAVELPAVIPPVPSAGPKAADVYQNVEVLGDLSVGEFTRLMAAITEWVSPEEGCTYCHGNNFADDDKYTKKVARVMIAMTQRVNESWGEKHVAPAGVTCYTCHRGKNVPEYVWVKDAGPRMASMAAANPTGQNVSSESVAYASLPYDPFTPYLEGDAEIRMAGDTALPTGNRQSIKQTEWTYALMMHFSDSLGVNCTYCHNSRAFAKWEQSPPTRLKAWHAIRMVREVNNGYIWETNDWLPDYRQGPSGDPQKVACNTCHQGAYKPLYGAPMIKDYPNLSKETAGAKQLMSAMAIDEDREQTDSVATTGGEE
ncbi:MAG: photosynthetic reaction center cytochrome PufC [Halieaceae bacterium]|jgi:photosynthetic reaction center cytochrome c subunit|nr:photosynthetic reaction center cytochrome PufC [Halieaceae bacterium]